MKIKIPFVVGLKPLLGPVEIDRNDAALNKVGRQDFLDLLEHRPLRINLPRHPTTENSQRRQDLLAFRANGVNFESVDLWLGAGRIAPRRTPA